MRDHRYNPPRGRLSRMPERTISRIVGSVTTTDDTQTVVATYSPPPGSYTWAKFSDVSVYGIDTVSGEVYWYRSDFLYKCDLVSGSLVGQDDTKYWQYADAGAALWSTDISISGFDLLARVTGEVGKTINWYCLGSIEEISDVPAP